MDDSVAVKVFERRDDLENVALDFELSKTLSAANELIEGLVVTEL